MSSKKSPYTAVKLGFKRALSRLCTCASSDDSHCFIANRNQRNTPGKSILTLIDLKLLRSATVCALLLFFCPLTISSNSWKAIDFLFEERRVTHDVALDFISHIWKFVTFTKVKWRNSKTKLISNTGIKYDSNKMIFDRRCVKEGERFFRWNSLSTLRRVKPQKLALFRDGTQIKLLRTRARAKPWKNSIKAY